MKSSKHASEAIWSFRFRFFVVVVLGLFAVAITNISGNLQDQTYAACRGASVARVAALAIDWQVYESDRQISFVNPSAAVRKVRIHETSINLPRILMIVHDRVDVRDASKLPMPLRNIAFKAGFKCVHLGVGSDLPFG